MKNRRSAKVAKEKMTLKSDTFTFLSKVKRKKPVSRPSALFRSQDSLSTAELRRLLIDHGEMAKEEEEEEASEPVGDHVCLFCNVKQVTIVHYCDTGWPMRKRNSTCGSISDQSRD